MGFKLDVIVEKEYIDHGHDGKPYYYEDFRVSGTSCTDTIFFEQDGSTIQMSVVQFKELMNGIRESSLWAYCDFRNL